MGVILDSSVLIAGERRGESVRQILKRVQAAHGEVDSALSVVTIVELTHGIYRAKSEADRERRRAFSEELRRDMVVHPVTMEIAELAGRIEGEQATRGVSIAFLLIGTTALHLGYAVVTINVRRLLLTANRAFPVVTIHREKVDAGACSIGRVVNLSKGRVTLLEIGRDATWDDELETYRLSEITRVDFGGDYEDALQLIGGREYQRAVNLIWGQSNPRKAHGSSWK